MTYTYDELTVSDLHKDAYGYRPSQGWWRNWNSMSPADKQEEWEYLCKRLDEEMEIERERQAVHYDRWSSRIHQLMVDHGISRGDAIRWDMQAAECVRDVSYYCYYNGLSYSVEGEIMKALEG